MREVAHVYLVSAGRVVLLERAAGLRAGGFWAPPGGHLEAGESPRAAALRELQEELGVCLAPSTLTLLRRAPFRERTGPGVNWLYVAPLAALPVLHPAPEAARFAAAFPFRFWPRPLLPWAADDLRTLAQA